MTKDYQSVQQLFTSLKIPRDQTQPLWNDISRYVGINTNSNLPNDKGNRSPSTQLDQYVDDPTAAISVNQAGDYMVGIMWGTGEGVMDLIPSRYVKELVDTEIVQPFFDFATDQTLYHMNHHECGYNSALRPYAYDQFSFGTSGIGIFPNRGFKEGKEENALVARQYGIDNVVIDEGKSGLVEYVFATYNWRINRIVGEFCMDSGTVDNTMLAKLPKDMQAAYRRKDTNTKFSIVFGFMPRDDYDPKLKGKKGTRYRGVWFVDENNTTGDFLKEEDFAERPINIARMIRIRGEVWGRASGTMLISSIRSINYMIGTSIEVMEKMADPALGIFSNAIFGDSVLDTSPSGLTVFNSTLSGGGAPTFQLHEVGDPTALVQFLVPYLNEKVVTAFKVDTLLDFAANKEMTATESMQRYVIRGQSLSGVLTQQKNERLIPDIRRSVSILLDVGELGVNPQTDAERAKTLTANGRGMRVIPDAVLACIAAGKPWYEIRFNNEMEKLIRTDTVNNLLKVLSSVGAIAGLYPEIVLAVNWYKLLKDINDNLDANNQILLTESQFKEAIAKIEQAKQAAAQAQLAQAGAATAKDATAAQKNQAEARSPNGR